MRFSAIFAALASAMFVSAIPAPIPAPEALAERTVELERKAPADIGTVLTKLNKDVKPHCDALCMPFSFPLCSIIDHALNSHSGRC